jgi:hypothetical protein
MLALDVVYSDDKHTTMHQQLPHKTLCDTRTNDFRSVRNVLDIPIDYLKDSMFSDMQDI